MLSTPPRVEPRHFHIGEAVRTEGDVAADLASQVGFAPYGPEQRSLLDGIFAKDERDKSVAFEVALISCRQNIKTSTFIMATLTWLFLYHIDLIVWTAHEWDAVDETVEDFDRLIGGSHYLARQVKQFNRARLAGGDHHPQGRAAEIQDPHRRGRAGADR